MPSISYPESLLWLLGQSPGATQGLWPVARIDSGKLEFYYRRISAVNQSKPNKQNYNFFEFPRVSPGDQPLAKEYSEYEIVMSCEQLVSRYHLDT